MSQKAIIGGLGVLAAAGCSTTEEEKSITLREHKLGSLRKGDFSELVRKEHQRVTGFVPTVTASIERNLEAMRRATTVSATADTVTRQVERYGRMVDLAEALQGAVTVTAQTNPQAVFENWQRYEGWTANTATGTSTFAAIQYLTGIAEKIGDTARVTIPKLSPEQEGYSIKLNLDLGNKQVEAALESKTTTAGLQIKSCEVDLKDDKDAKPLELELRRVWGETTTAALDPATKTQHTTQSNATFDAVRELLSRCNIAEAIVSGQAVQAYGGSPVDASKQDYFNAALPTPTAYVTAYVIVNDHVYATGVTHTAFQGTAAALIRKHTAIEQLDVETLTKLTGQKDHKGNDIANKDDVLRARSRRAYATNDFGEHLALMKENYSNGTQVRTTRDLGKAVNDYAQSPDGQKIEIKTALTRVDGSQYRGRGVVDPKKGGTVWDAKMSIDACTAAYGATTTARVLHEGRSEIRFLKPSETSVMEEARTVLERRGEFGPYASFEQAVKAGKAFHLDGTALTEAHQAARGKDGTYVYTPAITDALVGKEIHLQAWKSKK